MIEIVVHACAERAPSKTNKRTYTHKHIHSRKQLIAHYIRTDAKFFLPFNFSQAILLCSFYLYISVLHCMCKISAVYVAKREEQNISKYFMTRFEIGFHVAMRLLLAVTEHEIYMHPGKERRETEKNTRRKKIVAKKWKFDCNPNMYTQSTERTYIQYEIK